MPPVIRLLYEVHSPDGRWLAQIYNVFYIDHMWAGHPWCEVRVRNALVDAEAATVYVSNWMVAGKVGITWSAKDVLVISDNEMTDHTFEHPMVEIVCVGPDEKALEKSAELGARSA